MAINDLIKDIRKFYEDAGIQAGALSDEALIEEFERKYHKICDICRRFPCWCNPVEFEIPYLAVPETLLISKEFFSNIPKRITALEKKMNKAEIIDLMLLSGIGVWAALLIFIYFITGNENFLFIAMGISMASAVYCFGGLFKY